MDTIEWAAGIIEGEGCFSNTARGNELKVTVNMTDEDIIHRLHAAMGVGRVYGPYQHSKLAKKPYWRWVVQDKVNATAAMRRLYPLMGNRRRAKIDSLLGE